MNEERKNGRIGGVAERKVEKEGNRREERRKSIGRNKRKGR